VKPPGWSSRQPRHPRTVPPGEDLVQLDDELVAKLDELATRTSVSRSELLRRGALSVIEADNWAQADKRLVEGYTKYPPDPVLLETSRRLAAETAPEW
jgi:metal-responsive CopG/Arc/MetJ family transcriptional regulator